MLARRVSVVLLTAFSLVSAAFGQSASADRPADAPGPSSGRARAARVRLKDGNATSTKTRPIPPAVAAPLTPEETDRILAVLPPLAAPPLPSVALALPSADGSGVGVVQRPPDRSFPAAEDAAPEQRPLQVTLRSPEGPIELASIVSVTFSRPVGPLGALDAVRASFVPLRLTPQPPGRWRWLEPQTVVFEPVGRLPMATDYEVEVVADAHAADGSRLAAPVRWTFSTPAPKVVRTYPVDAARSVPRDTIFAVVFDQEINPRDVLPTISARVGPAAIPLRLATLEEVAAAHLFDREEPKEVDRRVVAVVPTAILPADSRVELTVGPGVPSAEGPKTSHQPFTWGILTRGPLALTKVSCSDCSRSWREDRAEISVSVEFNNPIDVDAFRADMVRVTPPLEGMEVTAQESSIIIRGDPPRAGRYTLTVSRQVTDESRQVLGRDRARTFDVSPWEPLLDAPGPFVVLDASGPLEYPVDSVNCKSLTVRVYPASPNDWSHLWLNRFDAVRTAESWDFRKPILSQTVPLRAGQDVWARTAIDLRPALANGTGQLVIVVESAAAPLVKLRAWVQVTHLGLAAVSDDHEAVAWVTSLKDGLPLAGVEVSTPESDTTRLSRADGLATVRLARNPSVVIARRGSDLVFIPCDNYSTGRFIQGERTTSPRRTWFAFPDRGVYRAGEEIKVKGWVRSVSLEKFGDVQPASPHPTRRIAYRALTQDNREILSGTTELDGFGAFDLSLSLPPKGASNEAAGALRVEFRETPAATPAARIWRHDTAPDHHLYVDVRDYVRPEFAVLAAVSGPEPPTPQSPRPAASHDVPHVVGESATVSLDATYYGGGALVSAPVTWTATTRPTHFTPPDHADFAFGRSGSWRSDPFAGDPDAGVGSDPEAVLIGHTDLAGRHSTSISFLETHPAYPFTVSVAGRVADVNRHEWTSVRSMLVHPASVYVGLRIAGATGAVRASDPLVVDVVVTDVAGRRVAGRPVVVRLFRIERARTAGTWNERAVEAGTCEIESAAVPLKCTFKPAGRAGRYTIAASVRDAQGRVSDTNTECWMFVSARPRELARDWRRPVARVVLDKDTYAPGDTARIQVVSPFRDAEGLLTIARSGVVMTRRFRMHGLSHVVPVRIDDRWTPNVTVHVTLTGRARRTGSRSRPLSVFGRADVEIPPVSRMLTVAVVPRERVLPPGGTTVIDVNVRDWKGAPVPDAEFAVVVTDESVLALTGFRTPQPLHPFYPRRPSGVRDVDIRTWLLDPWRRLLGYEGGVVGGVAGGMPGELSVPQLRQDFRPLALFAARCLTDATGAIHVPVTLPDTLTRYRVMVVGATRGNQFGSGESSITAGRAIALRAAPPRFLNVGDRAELSLVVQNQSGEPLDVDVAIRGTNVALPDGGGRHVIVPARDRVELRVPAAAEVAGTAHFQAAVVSERESDGIAFDIPVEEPAAMEAYAAYGRVDDDAVSYRLQSPSGARPDVGGLDVTTAASALQALTDSLVRLHRGGDDTDQVASRLLARIALHATLPAIGEAGLAREMEVTTGIRRDIQSLVERQRGDGGFGIWRRDDDSEWPYLGIHAAHALQRAKGAGYPVPAKVLELSRRYLAGIRQRIPAFCSPIARVTIETYALYVRSLLGGGDPAEARRLLGEWRLEDLSFRSVGWLLAALAGDRTSTAERDRIRGYLLNHTAQTAAAAHFIDSYDEESEYLLFGSSREADAVVLDALIRDDPASPLVPKLMEGLFPMERSNAVYDAGMEDAFVLVALQKYFETYERQPPNFIAESWLGRRLAGAHTFAGRASQRRRIHVPTAALPKDPVDLVIRKVGPGRLYYRLGLRYAPPPLTVAPSDHGFHIERTYAGLDDPGDVTRDDEGTWHIRAGARIRVTLTTVATGRRQHVAVVDPRPAGLEPIDQRFQGVDNLDDLLLGDASNWWRFRRWYDHDTLRDGRTEVFAALLPAGIYAYTYAAHARTPGTYMVGPARVEERYHPETFGRTASEKVVVYQP